MNRLLMSIITCIYAITLSFGFVPYVSNSRDIQRETVSSLNEIKNPIAGLFDMFHNFDAVIDDFMDKKMGNGEVFYGKRKYNPSGEFEGDYEGFGLTDFRKIEGAKEMKEVALERKQQREQQQSMSDS